MERQRCRWAQSPEIMTRYHDEEWGVPVRDDDRLFEFLVLETFQAGLSWLTILKRREGMREALDGFDPTTVARYDEARLERLLQDERLIRNRAKVHALVANANAFLDVQAKHGTFAAYMWDFVDGVPVANEWAAMSDVPATTPLAERVSKDLKKRGFKFVGPTIVYAHMQATGMVNDHLADCFRYAEVHAEGSE